MRIIQYEEWRNLMEKLGAIYVTQFFQICCQESEDNIKGRHTKLSDNPYKFINSIMNRRKEFD